MKSITFALPLSGAGYGLEAALFGLLSRCRSVSEVVVVGDDSAKGAWEMLYRLRREESRLRCVRLNSPMGTAFAMNCAVRTAGGDAIFFSDSVEEETAATFDRVIAVLARTGVLAVVCPGKEWPTRYALAVRREVFAMIGAFNCTREQWIEEFVCRLTAFAAAASQTGAVLRFESPEGAAVPVTLVAGLATVSDRGSPDLSGAPTPDSEQFRASYRRIHAELGAGGFVRHFRFPALRDLVPVAPSLSCLPNPVLPVVASLCSVPERVGLLEQTLASLAPQVDALHLYLDRYDVVPDFVRTCRPQPEVVLSRTAPGLRDVGKFLPLSGNARESYWFTADDDIVYPPDYVASMIRRLEHYGHQAVVGVHGVLLPEQADAYFMGYRKVHWFGWGLECDALVNCLGTGTVAFHSSVVAGLSLGHFRRPGMADLYFALFCKQNRIPLVAVSRPDAWLLSLPGSEADSLYEEFRHDDSAQAAVVRAHRPWGYAAVRDAVAGVRRRQPGSNAVDRLTALLPCGRACAS